MNSPPIVGVARFSQCNWAISGESDLIGSWNRRLSQAIHCGPNSKAAKNAPPAARPARGVIFCHVAKASQ